MELTIEQIVFFIAGIIAIGIGFLFLTVFYGGTENFLRLLLGGLGGLG